MKKTYRAKSYTQEEINKSLDYLTKEVDRLLDLRQELNKDLSKARKNISYWESIDERQLKMF